MIFRVFTDLCDHHTILGHCLSFSPSPTSPALDSKSIGFLSLWLCLFWASHTNVITSQVAFYAWLHSLATLFQGASQ